MQDKTQCLEATEGSVGLRIDKDKSKIMNMMTDCLQTARVGSGVVRIDVLSFPAGCRTRRLNQA